MLHRGWTLYSYFISFVTSTTAGAELVLPMLLVHIVTFPHTALPWGCTQPYIDISPTIFWYFTSFVTSTTTGAVLVLPVLRWFGTCSNTVLPRGWTECPAIPGRNAPLMAPLPHTAYMHRSAHTNNTTTSHCIDVQWLGVFLSTQIMPHTDGTLA